jgi:hypothetical protein
VCAIKGKGDKDGGQNKTKKSKFTEDSFFEMFGAKRSLEPPTS